MGHVIELVVDRKKIIDRKIDRDSDVPTLAQTIEVHEKTQGYLWDRQQPIKSNLSIDNNNYHNPIVTRDE